MTAIDLGRTRLGLGTAQLASDRGGPLWLGPQDHHDVAVATVRGDLSTPASGSSTPRRSTDQVLAQHIVADAMAGMAVRPPILPPSAGRCVIPPAGSVRTPVPAPCVPAWRRAWSASGSIVSTLCRSTIPDPDTPIEDTWEALMALVDEGLVDAAGLSNHSIAVMERALAVGPIAVVQHQYSLLDGEAGGVIQWCHERGVPFLAWSPLASGFLTDSFDLGTLDPDDLRHRLRWATTDAERVARVRDVLGQVADRYEATMVTVQRWRGRHVVRACTRWSSHADAGRDGGRRHTPARTLRRRPPPAGRGGRRAGLASGSWPKSELQEYIRAVPLLAGLLPSEVERITMVMNPIDVAAGEVVCTEGEPGHEFYVVPRPGEAAVEHAGGRQQAAHRRPLRRARALLDRGPRSATVRATTDCRLYVLQEASFAAVLNEVPALAQKLLASLARRLRQVESQLALGGGTRSAS